MTASTTPVSIALRIPGPWSHPRELVERLPEGCRLTGESLFLPDGFEAEFGAAKADNQFAQIFRSSCRQPPTEDELAIVEGYTANIYLGGPGGSLQAAQKMMEAGAAIVRAGGAGVFIDNCTLAHGGQDWLAMTEDGSPDALSFAFVAIVGGKTNVWTMGLHALGMRDVVMKRVDSDDFDIVEVIRYLARSEKPIDDGHLIADLSGPRFQVFSTGPVANVPVGSPMHNPFGRFRLVSMRDIASNN